MAACVGVGWGGAPLIFQREEETVSNWSESEKISPGEFHYL